MNYRHGSLWAITSLFNPAGYRRRLDNYRRFRAALPVPLATVELGFNDHWDLGNTDADLYLRVGDGDVLWQKERLLNLVLPQLPPECGYVAWIDSDVLLQDPAWPQKTVHTLASVPLLQLFSSLHYLTPDGHQPSDSRAVESVTANTHGGHSFASAISNTTDRTGGAPVAGMAWAARRELLQRHGLYDGCVIGGGDTALCCAAHGMPELAMELHHMNGKQRERYGAWALRFHADVRGEVGVLDGGIHHLWHGELINRRAGLRHLDLAPHSFDPFTDIAAGNAGAWRWASNKPAFHGLLRDYFAGRQEDG